MQRRRFLIGLGSAIAAPLAIGDRARAAWAPTRPVTVVVPYPAGGGTDVLARILAKDLSGALGQNVLVENQAGASGAVGTRRVARAEPDGQILVLSTNQTHATNISLLKDGGGYDPIRDFTTLGGLADLQHLLVVRKDLPVRDVAGLLALARKEPGKLNGGSTGIGSASHLTLELFRLRTGVEVAHVPYRGAAPLLQDMIGGRIDVAFATVPTVLGQVRSGDLRALAVASPRLSPQVPEAPILAEAGVTGVEADAWLAIFAPAHLPAEIRTRYRDLLMAALDKPEVQSAIAAQGMVLNWREPEAFAAFQREDVRRWAEIIKTVGIAPE